MTKIIEKIQKLLALAGSANEHEAALAIEKAHEILAAHNLSMETVEDYTPEEPEDEERGMMHTETKFSEKYFAWIWASVAEAHFCTMFSRRPDPKLRRTIYTMVGRKVNTVVATQLAMYLCQTVKRLSNEAAKESGRKDHAYKNAFIAGCSDRLSSRVMAMARKAPVGQTTNALVVLTQDEQKRNSDFLVELGLRIRERKSKETKIDPEGYVDGLSAGDKVSLNQQLTGKASHLKVIK